MTDRLRTNNKRAARYFSGKLTGGSIKDDSIKKAAYELALDALRRSIPHKAIRTNEHFFYCPTCGEPLKGERFCQSCGQSISWVVD